MRIGIDVNGVLRDTVGKFDQLYTKHLIESDEDPSINQTYEIDMSGNPQPIANVVDKFDYKKVSEVTSLKLDDHYTFKSSEELFTFMYEEYAMELFGHAPSTEMTTFNMLNDFYLLKRDQDEIIVVSSEIGKSKPSTLFFLAKFGCLVEKVIFFSEITKNNMWDQVDILLTANPSLLLEKPNDKFVVKYNTDYNKHIDSKFEISSFSEFDNIIKKIEENVI
jgi:hypothetical protein